ncbi:MAG: PhoH family protein, partial [Verrucomicrobiota bacterium]
MATEKVRLDFESGVFLHSLMGGDVRELGYLEEMLGLQTVTRDGWVSLEGTGEAVEAGKRVFADLEEARRGGALLSGRDFRLAVDLVAKESEQSVSRMVKVRLLGERGKKPVVPKTPGQASYIEAMQEHDVTFGLGPAGTGKTYLAMAMALSLLKAKEVNRVVLT